MKLRKKLRLCSALTAITVLLSILLSIPVFAEDTLAGSVNIAENTAKNVEKSGSDFGVEEGSLGLKCKSAVLMEATTGAILYLQNPDEALPPASVTKIMTLLLLMEAIDGGTIHLTDPVTVSANAASMGGSQVYLKEGEQMPLEDLLKSVVIASANDAAVALAEYLCGSVDVFVAKMNDRAKELGMNSTAFENVTGLDDTAVRHLTSARDIAIMSRELIKHKTILQYSSIWMDSIRNGEFGLTNTNRLVRFYKGCTGLKTGSTSKAGFCISVTAERNGFSLISVIMGAENRDTRNAAAAELLDWGFANYGIYHADATDGETIPLIGGKKDTLLIGHEAFSAVLPKESVKKVTVTAELPESAVAPVKSGDTIGKILYRCGERVIGEISVRASEDAGRIGFFEILGRMFTRFLLI